MSNTFQRARAPEQKADRRAHLLQKASELFEREGLVPTAAQLAKSANIAKGTVYLYFRSKQEIFLALLEEQFALFFDELAQHLRLTPPRRGDDVGSALIQILHARHQLLPLAVMGPTELENNAPDEALLSYKRMLAEKMGACAEIIAELPNHSVQSAQQRMTQSYAMIIGLHQLANNSKRLCTLFREHGLETLVPEFWPQLDDALQRLWRDVA